MKLESCEACMQMTNHGCLKCASKQSRLSAIDECIEIVRGHFLDLCEHDIIKDEDRNVGNRIYKALLRAKEK